MQKKLVNIKRDVLRQMEPKDLVDHICKYPNQDFLNFDDKGKRHMPVGAIAHSVQNNNYEMSDAQYYTMLHHFAKITVPDVKVVGVTFYENDPTEFARKQISDDGRGHQMYEVDYALMPEPTNEYDKNAVRVGVKEATQSVDGVQEYAHIGYLPADFVAIHPIGETMEVHGFMKDLSNGHFSNVSYQLPLDLEELNAINARALGTGLDNVDQLSAAGQLSVDEMLAMSDYDWDEPLQEPIHASDLEYDLYEGDKELLREDNPEFRQDVSLSDEDLADLVKAEGMEID